MSISKARALLGPLTVVSLAWVASVPVADVALRALGDRPALDLAGLYQPFANGSYKHAPLVDTDANWQMGHFAVHTDSLGLRCDPLRRNAAKAGDDIDVLVLGDSQAYGQGADYENTLVGSLANEAAVRGVRVRNAAVGGQYLANQFDILRWLRNDKHVRTRSLLVLLTPRLIASAGKLNVVRVGDDGRLYSVSAPGSGFRQSATLWIKAHTVLYTRLRDAMRAVGLPRNSDGSSGAVSFYLPGQREDAIRARLLEEMRRLLDAGGPHRANVYLVYTPLVVEQAFEPIRKAAAARGQTVDPNVPYRVAAAVAASLGMPLLDLRPVLARLKADGEQLTLRADPHYSGPLSRASGAAILAWLTAASGQTEPPQEIQK